MENGEQGNEFYHQVEIHQENENDQSMDDTLMKDTDDVALLQLDRTPSEGQAETHSAEVHDMHKETLPGSRLQLHMPRILKRCRKAKCDGRDAIVATEEVGDVPLLQLSQRDNTGGQGNGGGDDDVLEENEHAKLLDENVNARHKLSDQGEKAEKSVDAPADDKEAPGDS